MISMANVRSMAALVLMASVLMPQYSCTKTVDVNGKGPTAEITPADSAKYHSEEIYHYALEDVQLDQPLSWLLPFAFLWPLAFAALSAWQPEARATRVIRWLEPALLVGSLWMIGEFGVGATRRFGNYVALAAAAALVAISVWESIGRFRRWRANRAAPVPV